MRETGVAVRERKGANWFGRLSGEWGRFPMKIQGWSKVAGVQASLLRVTASLEVAGNGRTGGGGKGRGERNSRA